MPVSHEVLVASRERARARLAQFNAAGRNRGPSDATEAVRRNVLGVLGEQAALRWLQGELGDDASVRDSADSSDGPSDLEVTSSAGVLGIEVKTTTYDRWLRHGRLVPEDQLYDTDAEVYVWCAGPNTHTPTEIHLVGWCTAERARSERSTQLFTGIRAAYTRATPAGGMPSAHEAAPAYDLTDPVFDDYEWQQTAAARDISTVSHPDPPDDWAETPHLDPLATLTTAPMWLEGTDPRPGFGPAQAVVRVTARVRPLASLPEWIRNWEPRS